MGGDVVQAQYEQLDAIAQRFGNQAKANADLYKQMERSVQALQNGGWIGQGASAFFAEMNGKVFPAQRRLTVALEKAQTVTLEIKKLVQAAEEEAAQPFRGAAINNRINSILNNKSIDVASIKGIVTAASNSERQAIWSDAALMDKLRSKLSPKDYLDLVISLRMLQPGSVSHTSATDADTAIRNHLSRYVADAVKQGKKIEGAVAVVDDKDWDVAGIAHYGKSTWESGKRDGINAFVDSEGRVWVHKDRGNRGTVIHEAVHKYADHAMLNTSQPLNEGITEYFTRSVGGSVKPPITGRGNYQGNHDFVTALVGSVGEQTVADAYFGGNIEGLKQAYIKTGKSEADWNALIQHTQNNRWADAERLLK